jgi:hypothetical protein
MAGWTNADGSKVMIVDCTDSREGCLPYYRPLRYNTDGGYDTTPSFQPAVPTNKNEFTVVGELPTANHIKTIFEGLLLRGTVGRWEIDMTDGRRLVGHINARVRSELHVGQEYIEFSPNPMLYMNSIVQLVRNKGAYSQFLADIREVRFWTWSYPEGAEPELRIQRPETKPGEVGCLIFTRMVDARYIAFKRFRLGDDI